MQSISLLNLEKRTLSMKSKKIEEKTNKYKNNLMKHDVKR